jgi:hypothetical protein
LTLRLTAFLATLSAIAAIAAGCGGGGGDDGGGSSASEATTTTASTTSGSLSKAEFVAKSDAACRKGSESATAELSSYMKEKAIPESREPNAEQFAEIVAKILVPALHRQVDEIRALGAPASDEQEVDAILDSVESSIAKAEAEPELARSTTKLFAKADKLAQEYGFKFCGNQ